jgi:gamma-F420-2:alpha-L-glutamate ligase
MVPATPIRSWILVSGNRRESYTVRRFSQTARECGVCVQPVVPGAFDIITTKEGRKSIYYEGKLTEMADCLIPRMGSATTYFALAVIRHLERLGVFVLNSSLSIETARDKLATMQILAANSIPTPKTMLAKFPLSFDIVEKEFSYPIVIKTVSGSHGKGVFLCNTRTQFEDIANLIEVSRDPRVNVIIQEFIRTSRGRDIRVLLVGGRPIGAMVRTAKQDSFKANYTAGGSVAPFTMNAEVEWLAVEAASLVGLDIAGVDILFDGDSYSVCEINSSPGFEGFEYATGIDVPKEIFRYLSLRLGQ